MFTQNDNQDIQQPNQQPNQQSNQQPNQQSSAGNQAQSQPQGQSQTASQPQTAQGQPQAAAQDNYVSSYQPPQDAGTHNQGDEQPAQEPPAAGSVIKSPPGSAQPQQQPAQPDQQIDQQPEGQLDVSTPIQELDSQKQDSEEGFLPPQQPAESIQQENTQAGQLDSAQQSAAASANETQNENDSISEKLDELEAMVQEFEQKSAGDDSLAKNENANVQPQSLKTEEQAEEQTNEQQPQPAASQPGSSAPTQPQLKNKTKKENQMDNPNADENNQVGVAGQTASAPPSTPASRSQAQAGSAQQAQAPQSETLADQNIFFLLGAEGSSTDEQEQFLDELQQVIWEDFLEKDMDLLITSQEKERADQILQDQNLDEIQKQEQLLQYLDELVPDLEEIMMNKALQLKKELVLERAASLKETLANDPGKLQQIQEAEQLMNQNKWLSAGEKLNQIN